KLDPRGSVPYWFSVVSEFMLVQGFSSVNTSVLNSEVFFLVKDELHDIWSSCFKVYTNRSLRNAGSIDTVCGAAAYFLVLNRSVDVVVGSLLFSTLAELQAVVLTLECVSFSCRVILHTDSQAAIDVCLLELSCAVPDFHNQCWLERCHIFNLVKEKDLEMVWVKVKDHFGISGNVKADLVAGDIARSLFSLLAGVYEHYLVAKNTAISSNAHHFAGPGVDVIPVDLVGFINWIFTMKVWHPNFHMLTGFTSQKTSNLCSYLMKAVHRRFSVAVRKRLYDKGYPGILCLLCGGVEFSDHAFTCFWNVVICDEVLVKTSACWVLVADVCDSSSSAVLWILSACSLDVGLYSIVCKGFEAWGVFEDKKQTIGKVVSFVRFMEKAGLVADGRIVSGLSHDVSSILSGGILWLSFAVLFFSGLGGVVSVNIGV
ncbi:hypothetical protein G9A89_014979, partial [Geosiphon pyriformis]